MFKPTQILRVVTVLFAASSLLLTGCVSQKVAYTEAEQLQINQHQAFVDQAQQFVHANLFAGMIEVWNTDRLAWNTYLNANLCGAIEKVEIITKTTEINQPIFINKMAQAANHQGMFLESKERAVLEDISRLTYQLFSASYAKGYARQVGLADDLSPGLLEEMCHGRVLTGEGQKDVNVATVQWSSFSTPLLANNNGLMPHAQNGTKAFQQLLQQQYAQFDALVYSHAYQQSEAYQVLFFEVNKYENVQFYGNLVGRLSEQINMATVSQEHDDFAYLILSSGYHWGMLSVLMVLEQEYPRLHDRKKKQAALEIQTITEEIEAKNEQG